MKIDFKLFIQPFAEISDLGYRSSRKAYWTFFLGYFILMSIIMTLFGKSTICIALVFSFMDAPAGYICGILCGYNIDFSPSVFFAFFMLIPGFGLTVRRLNDVGVDWKLIWIGMVPFLGGFVLLFYLAKKELIKRGTNGAPLITKKPRPRDFSIKGLKEERLRRKEGRVNDEDEALEERPFKPKVYDFSIKGLKEERARRKKSQEKRKGKSATDFSPNPSSIPK